MIEGIQKGAVLADQCDLGGSGTGIDSEETVSFVSGKVFFHNLCLRVTLTEGVKLCLVLEQRIQSLDLKCNLDLVVQPIDHILCGYGLLTLGEKCGTGSCEQMRKCRNDRVFLIKVQSTDKALPKLGQEMKRAS